MFTSLFATRAESREVYIVRMSDMYKLKLYVPCRYQIKLKWFLKGFLSSAVPFLKTCDRCEDRTIIKLNYAKWIHEKHLENVLIFFEKYRYVRGAIFLRKKCWYINTFLYVCIRHTQLIRAFQLQINKIQKRKRFCDFMALHATRKKKNLIFGNPIERTERRYNIGFFY